MELCTNNVIANIKKLLLKLETEDELIKNCMITWPKKVQYNITVVISCKIDG